MITAVIATLGYQFFWYSLFLLSFLTNSFLVATKHVSLDLSVYEADMFGPDQQIENEANSVGILKEEYKLILRKVLEAYEKQSCVREMSGLEFPENRLLMFKTMFYENKDFLPNLNSYAKTYSLISYFSCAERNRRRELRFCNWVYELNKKIELLVLTSKAEKKDLLRMYLKYRFRQNYN